MIENKNIAKILLPEPTISRLPWYLAYLNLQHSRHVEYVSSTQIAKEINVDASQIAKDLSFLNIKGKTRIGYEVETLVNELEDFLGFKQEHNAFMIGVGSLGSALIQDSGLTQFGLNIVAGFDVNTSLIGTDIGGVPIFSMDELDERQKEFGTEIGILAVPAEHAQDATDTMIACGIQAIWNFTPSRIKASNEIVIQNTSIYAHLAVMYNRLEEKKRMIQ